MKKVFEGVFGLFSGKKTDETESMKMDSSTVDEQIVIEKEEIEQVLPHRGRMLLLDRVTITPKMVIGEFLITEKVCEGHGVLGGQTVLKGSDLLDMAAQLLGIWASRNVHFEGKAAVVREFGGAKFQRPILSGELVRLEIEPRHLRGEIEVRGARELSRVEGREFIVSAGGKRKAVISSVELAVLPLPPSNRVSAAPADEPSQ